MEEPVKDSEHWRLGMIVYLEVLKATLKSLI